ncbi:acyl-CoA dehydrogenase domain protein [Gonapodya prolifera JEL478]|uniref:Acyl-CoA dehydrogenase domain protein n=1 Tax=Gonapodya prolifera (strain JEL478) TaxID=1344416 RepID=A0A139A318_GONPJ|nr:acyl-CoA dehydrogenase domain protein [Gonapodya prolifera JEL478]|eukprot:KXS10773.1 acyl-CoA dehydrogenase domain protein [Gonapodya prolifera JEL478]
MSKIISAVDVLPLRDHAKRIYQLAVDFVENECIPAEEIYGAQMAAAPDRWNFVPPIVKELQKKARALGLWNLFLTEEYGPEISKAHLSIMEYSVICEIFGRASLAPIATNCAAPDTGNMEVLAMFGTPAQKEKWLKPLMNAEIRSAFVMTDPDVASSDATNIATSMTKSADGKHYIINGRKHWISNFSHPDCRLLILVGKTGGEGGRHGQHTVVLIEKPKTGIPGLTVVRHLSVFGYDHAPGGHDELLFQDVKVPVENVVLGEGKGFAVLQGRLGGGRIHHCMRSLGQGERAIELMLLEATNPKKRPFGKLKGEHGKIQWDIAQCRIKLEMCKHLVYAAAMAMDKKGYKAAAREIAMAKVAVPQIICEVIDSAIQVHGGLGISQSTELAHMYGGMRTLRFADGPDEAHAAQLARTELKNAAAIRAKHDGYKKKEVEMRKQLRISH